MLIWSAGGAPPPGPGNTRNAFAAIRFHSVTPLAAGCAWTGADRPLSITTSETNIATIRTGLDFVIRASALTRALCSLMTAPRFVCVGGPGFTSRNSVPVLVARERTRCGPERPRCEHRIDHFLTVGAAADRPSERVHRRVLQHEAGDAALHRALHETQVAHTWSGSTSGSSVGSPATPTLRCCRPGRASRCPRPPHLVGRPAPRQPVRLLAKTWRAPRQLQLRREG